MFDTLTSTLCYLRTKRRTSFEQKLLDFRYNTVSDDVQFVQQAFEVFEHIFQSLRARAANVDQQKLVRTLLNHLIRHCRCFRQSVECAAVQDKANEDRWG